MQQRNSFIGIMKKIQVILRKKQPIFSKINNIQWDILIVTIVFVI